MKEKINIAELLKDCPYGMELDCTLFDNVIFYGISNEETIVVRRESVKHKLYLDKYGCPLEYPKEDLKCVIFPKGKTTWEGFIPPCKFKDGDVVYTSLGNIALLTDKQIDECFSICCILIDDTFEITESFVRPLRFATEEEKRKLFDAIKENGYKWNAETKTLEKLVKPKFKVGDKIRHKTHIRQGNTVTEIKDTHYILDDELALPFISQDEYELVPNKFDITTLKPFENRVLVRGADGDLWKPAIYGFLHPKGCYVVGGVYWRQCIPYEGNEHLIGTTNDCDDFYKTWE